MTKALSATEMLNREFLEIRCRLLDIAAALDRIDRAGDAANVGVDPRRRQIADALAMIAGGGPDRAERVQMVFSDRYDPAWRTR